MAKKLNELNLKLILESLEKDRNKIYDFINKEDIISFKDNGYDTVFYELRSNIFSISSEKNIIKEIGIIGGLNSCINDFLSQFKNFREEYSPKDDVYLYFFNEETEKGLIFMLRSDNKIINGFLEGEIHQLSVIFKDKQIP